MSIIRTDLVTPVRDVEQVRRVERESEASDRRPDDERGQDEAPGERDEPAASIELSEQFSGTGTDPAPAASIVTEDGQDESSRRLDIRA